MASEWQEFLVEDLASGEPNALATGPFGSAISSKHFTNSGVPVIRGSNLSADVSQRLIDDGIVYVSHEKAKEFRRSIAVRGDLVFTCWGTINQVGLIDHRAQFNEYIVSNKQMKLSVDRAKVDPLFLYYLFSGPEKQAEILDNGIGSSVPGFNLGQLRRHTVLLPPLAEQKQIVECLGALDDKIVLLRETNATLEAIAQAIFKSWFVDFDPVRAKAEGRDPEGLPPEVADLFPSEFEDSDLGEIPKGWRVSTFEGLAEVSGGSTPSTKEPFYWEGGSHHWATPKDLSALDTPVLLETERQITDAGLDKISSGLLPAGTVLLSSRAPIGYLAVAEVPVAVNQGFIALKPKRGVSNLYLLRLVEARMDDIKSRANGSTFLEISKRAFRPIPVLVPPVAIMDVFDGVVRPLHQRLVVNQRERNALASLRDTLLPRLMSGKLPVDRGSA